MPPSDAAFSDSLWEEYAEVDVADVVVDIEAPELQSSYSYKVPESLRNTLAVGACVHIPFAGRETLGYVLERRRIPVSDPLCGKLKAIIAVVEDAVTINAEQLHIVRWMSERYLCDLLTAIRCVAPATLGARVATVVRPAYPDMRADEVGASIPQQHLFQTLRQLGGEAEMEELKEAANLPAFGSAYSALLKKGVLLERRTVARAKTVEKTQKVYRLGAAASSLSGAGGGKSNRSPQQQRLMNELLEWVRHNKEPMPGDELLRAADAPAASLRGLLAKGIVEMQEVSLRRSPIASSGKRTTAPTLSPGQQQATKALRECLSSGQTRTVLLFGVTASGKTEVYLDAIAHTLSLGRTAIALVPEIALTTQVVDVFVGRFGEQVAVLHSRLSEGERHDEWRRIQAGHAKIVVGARSAVFAPLENVGLIVVDEEHEASYKQESTPRYNARDLAAERARISKATLLLGSATPSLESYHAATANTGLQVSGKAGIQVSGYSGIQKPTAGIQVSRYSGIEGRATAQSGADAGRAAPIPENLNASREAQHPNALPARESPTTDNRQPATSLIVMAERIDNRALPTVEVVDLRDEFKQRKALFSQRLIDAIDQRLRHKQQIILFLNRRGYAQFVLCRDCGFVARCPNCAVSVAFHSYDSTLRCHHCEYTGKAPQKCPDCGGLKVRAFGIGTEKVEEEVLKFFPSARVERMDRDTTSRKGSHSRIVRGFKQGDADILIGTQMVAKGLDFPNVTLVGVISADTSINMPDFRAAERTFQLLTQVAGRSGRGKNPGEVIIQTFSPEHYAIQTAMRQDYPDFYRQEILFRKELNYPPFARFANIICADPLEPKAAGRANSLAAALERVAPKEVEIIGPAPAPLARLKNHYRFHVALRAPVDSPLSEIVRKALAFLSQADRLGLHVDMDPLSMS